MPCSAVSLCERCARVGGSPLGDSQGSVGDSCPGERALVPVEGDDMVADDNVASPWYYATGHAIYNLYRLIR